MSWQQKKVGDLCKVGRGSSPRPINDERYFIGGTIPWIRVADATASRKYLYSTKQYVNDFGASFSRLLPVDSLIICTSGTLGHPVFLGVEGCIHDGWLYTYDYQGLDPHFFYYFLKWRREYFFSVAYGAAIQNINTEILRNTPILTPSLDEQIYIASILSAYDDLIENNLRRIEILEQSAQLLYKEWFVHLRFPGYEHTRFVNGVPEGWDKTTLGKTLTLNYGKGLKASDRIPGPYSVFGSSGVVGFHDEPLVEGPGIIVGRKGNVGSVYWSNRDFYPIDTVYFISKEESDYFIFHNLMNQTFINNDGAIPGLNRNYAYSRPLTLPLSKLRRQFNEYVEPVYKQIFNLQDINKKLEQARDLLLPKLMSGEIVV